MKKFYSIILLLSIGLIPFLGFGQNLVVNGDFEDWTAGAADNWLADGGAVTITQNATTVQSGASSCEVIWTSQDNQYLTSDPFALTPGIEINASFWAYDNDIAGRARLCIIYEGADNYYGDYSEDQDAWQELTYSEIVPSGATSAEFQIRFYDISGDWDGDAMVIVDNAVLEANATVNPEPTNYPTNFAADPSGTNIVTTWTDDVAGEQLPISYVLLGNNDGSDFTPPVDGTPVADDMNWDDGMIAMNVLYGAETYSIPVEANTEYTFTIFPYSNTGANIDYKTDGTPPTASATSSNSTVVSLEGFDNDLGVWTGYSVVSDEQAWEWASFGNPAGCAKMNGFAGAAVANEDWLLSPALDLTGFDTVSFSFDHARNYASNEGLFVLISTDYDGLSDPSVNGTWNDVTSMYTFPDPGSWEFMPAGSADVTTHTGASTYFAFKYTSTDSDASTWEVDNVLVYGVLAVGIPESKSASLSVYPNPANTILNLTSESDGQLSILNLAGQLIMSESLLKGENVINIADLESGIYFVQFIDSQKRVLTDKLIVQ